MKKIIIVITCFFCISQLFGQEKTDTAKEKKILPAVVKAAKSTNIEKTKAAPWLDKISIVKSFEDADSKAEPAILSATFPKDTNSSYLIDIGVGYTLYNKDLSSGELTTEFHRNTEIESEVENFQFGYSGEFILGRPKSIPTMAELLDPNYLPPYKTAIVTATMKYRWDGQEKSHGYVATGLISPFSQGGNTKVWLGSTKYNDNKSFGFYLLPSAGVELQQNLKADSSKMIGFVGRGVVKLNLGFGGVVPNDIAGTKKVIRPIKTWWFSVDGALRYDAIGKKFFEDRVHPMITTALDIYLVRNPVKVILGASFTYGDNPIEGFKEFKFEKQQFWILALKIQK